MDVLSAFNTIYAPARGSDRGTVTVVEHTLLKIEESWVWLQWFKAQPSSSLWLVYVRGSVVKRQSYRVIISMI